MCKKAICVIVLLLSGTWVQAQQSQPGYAVLSDQGSGRLSSSVAVGPPEPAVLGGPAGPPAGVAYPAAPPGMPVMPGPGMTTPAPGTMVGPGGPGVAVGPGMDGAGGWSNPVGQFMQVGPANTLGSETYWVNIGYVAGWITKPRLGAPLITEGSASDAHPGALNQPGTVSAFGDDNYKFGTYHGLQGEIGVNLNDQFYLEVNALVFPSQHINWTTASDAGGNPLIARPFFNTATGDERSFLTAFPGVLAGSTRVEAHSELWGMEIAGRYLCNLTPYLTMDFLLGYRRMELLENLKISDTLVPIAPSLTFLGNPVTPGPGTFVTDYDRFATNNTFNGVDFGNRFRWQSGFDWFAVSAYWKEALGETTQTVNISGATSLVTPTGITTAPGGILAQQSNGGNFTRTVFGSITEGGVGFIFIPCRYVRFEVGYSAIYWNSVVRPAQQINHAVTPSQVPTDTTFSGAGPGTQPTFSFHNQGITIQTLNVGLSFYY